MKHSQASNKIALLAKLLQQRKQSYSSPLSYGQQALWFIHQNAPESSAYNMAWAIQIEGKLQKEEFDKALQSMVERHPALRTAIHQVDGVPQQVVATSGECTLSEHLLMGASETIRSSAMHAVYGQAFDLEHGKAFRVDIFQTSAKQHCLLLTMHHIMGDATALNLLGNELLLLYRANITGNKPELAVISSTIADFVRDEQAMLDSETGAKMLCYWQKALENHAPLLSLPTDFPRPDVQHYDGASVPFALSQQQSTQIKALAKQQKSTLFAVLLTVFQVLLFRYTGQHDICIGTPTSTTRLQKTKFANLIAYLVNPVVLRANIDTPTTLTFLDLLEKNKQTVLEAVKHASYPFPLLVKHINVERDGRYPPLFQVMLDFKPAGFLPISNNLPDLTVSAIDFPQMEGQFDLTLSIADGDILQGCLKYNSELFHQKTIEHMVEHLKTLLTAIIDTPTQAIATLPLLAIQEAQQLQVWNNTARDYPNKDQTIVDLFEQQVQKTPDNIAVIFEKQQLTYQELNEQANQLAHYLCPLSSVLRPLIALAMDRSLGMVISLLAVFKTGAAYVPIDPSYPEARIAYMLDDSGAELLLTQSYLLAKLQRLTSGIRRVICIDTLNLAPQLKDNPVVDRQASDLAYVIYTSGSTGKPKGAMNAHAGIINRLLWMQETFQLTASDRVLQKTPCSFDVSVWEFFWPLITGAALVVAKPEGHKDPSYLTALIAKKQITTLHFVPSMLPHFLDHADPLQCASLTRVMCSGEALSVDLNRRFFTHFSDKNITLHNLYGPTEAAIDVSHWSCHSDDTCIPIGKPIANTRLHVLDANHQPLPIGIAGELCIAGIQLGLGYLNRPELTAEKFINVDIYGKSERIYKTGDLAKWNATGNVEYLGRMDNQVKLRGFRIELGEIETLLLQYPAITNGVVVIRDAGEIELTKQLVAYIVSSKVIDILQLRSYLNQQLPDYMIPSHIMAIDALPLLQNGKLDRKSLPEPIYNTNCYLYPRDVIEFRLIQIWEQLFGLPSVSLEDDFFAIGGDSLLAVRLIFEIEQVFAIHLPLPTIFQCRTIEQLAILLRKGTKPKDWSPIVCLQPEGKKTPLFFIHASGGSAFDHLDMAKNISTERPFYALHPKGIELHEEFHSSIEEMANDYVSAIRSVQSVGPYLLAGWSFGGTVAYAMAAIFEKLGERVPLVMMIDSPAISVNFNKDDDVEFLLDRLPHYHGMKLEHLDEDSSAEEQMAYLLNEIKLAGLFSPDIDPAYAKNWFELYKHHNSIISRYQPTDIISSQIAFFKPAEKTSFDIQMGDSIVEWSAFTDKKIIVNEGAGNHFNMVSPTNTPALAQQINNLIVAIHS